MAAQPEPWKSLRAALERISERVKRIEQRSPFFGTGMHTNGLGGIDSDNFVTNVSGYRLAETPEFNDILLRGGIIGNDALTNPSSPQSVYDSVLNFSVTTTLSNIKTVTIPVPAGFTSAAATLTVRAWAINSTAGTDYLYSQANINGFNGYALPMQAPAGAATFGPNVSVFSAVLSGAGLGSNLVLQIAVQTAFGTWAASSSNIADLSASVVWYR